MTLATLEASCWHDLVGNVLSLVFFTHGNKCGTGYISTKFLTSKHRGRHVDHEAIDLITLWQALFME